MPNIRKKKKQQKQQEKLLRRLRNDQALMQRLAGEGPQTPTPEEQPAAAAAQPPFDTMRQLCIDDLMHIDDMLCQSATAAADRHATNAEHLLRIIANQHLSVESLLRKLGVDCRRTAEGQPFDPETMQADALTAPTADAGRDGLVAKSLKPAFWHAGELMACELVRLYHHEPNKEE